MKPHCTVIFDSLDPKIFKAGFNKKEDKELKRLVGWVKKSGKYAYWAPILFADPNAKLDLRYAFRNSSLPLVFIFSINPLNCSPLLDFKVNSVWCQLFVADPKINAKNKWPALGSIFRK